MFQHQNNVDSQSNGFKMKPPGKDQEGSSNRQTGNGHLSVSEEWAALLSPNACSDNFLTELLSVQCRISGADGGVWLQAGPEHRVDIMAIYPPLSSSGRCDSWVALAAADFARYVISNGKTSVRREPTSEAHKNRPKRQIIVVPVQKNGAVVGAAAFVVPSEGPESLLTCQKTLEYTPFLRSHHDLQQALNRHQTGLIRVCGAMDVLSAFNRSSRFIGATTALCNEIATRWQCSRVSLGFLQNRYVHVKAMSHTNDFSRKMRLVQDLEAVMEECIDQDLEIVYPSPDTMAFINRAAKEFSNDHGPQTLVSLPIRHKGHAFAVLTLERPADSSFSVDEVEVARLTCDLCAARLMELREHDRWFGARIARRMHDYLAQLFKPKYTLHKCLATIVFLVLFFLLCAKGHYRVDSPFVFETTMQQAIVAPFDTYIKKVSVETGDKVVAGETVLGQLELSELRLELAALKAERIGFQKQNVAAMRDRKTADAQIAQAHIEKMSAKIRLLEERLHLGTLVAPITGRVISKDLKQQIGAPVKTGSILFEIAPITSLRAELYVPEDAISDIKLGQDGELLAVGHPNQKVPFVVERISPIADVVNQRNVFRVKVSLKAQQDWMRPGMAGVAKISIGKEPYVWIGSRRIANWLRMKLWL